MSDRSVIFTNVGVAKCPYSVALDYVTEYMSRFKQGVNEAVELPYNAIGLPIRGGFRHAVDLVFRTVEDCDNRSRSHQALSFDWDARTRFLPNLRGKLTFHIAGDGLTELTLICIYKPPFALIGYVFDLIVGRRLAGATARALLARIIFDIESREIEFRSTIAIAPR